jgi:DNA-binding protein Fis
LCGFLDGEPFFYQNPYDYKDFEVRLRQKAVTQYSGNRQSRAAVMLGCWCKKRIK